MRAECAPRFDADPQSGDTDLQSLRDIIENFETRITDSENRTSFFCDDFLTIPGGLIILPARDTETQFPMVGAPSLRPTP